ncbi:MAG: CPBP family intramembrane metalloprotease [Nocardioidaceae bacterium]|nr:CPBP family intramembrane metalloprotease [Nocardioidaceae bacterium]
MLLQVVVLVALVAVLGLYVRRDVTEYARFRALTDTSARVRAYRRWCLEGPLLFGGMTLVALGVAGRPFEAPLARAAASDLVSSARDGLGTGFVAAFVAAVVGGSVVGAVLASRSSGAPSTVGDIDALLPRNRAELPWGGVLSVTAGVFEELLFRLALPALVLAVTGSVVAAFVGPTLVFGLMHAYQGAAGVVGTTVVGVLMVGVYLLTGQLWVAIVLHVVIDLRALVLVPALTGARSRPA